MKTQRSEHRNIRPFQPFFPYHVLLLAVYPVLALLANNLGQIALQSGARAVLVSLWAALVLFAAACLLLRDAARAGILVSLVQLLFFTYGHVYYLLAKYVVLGMHLGRHELLAPLWATLFVLGAVQIFRLKAPPVTFGHILNLTSAGLLLIATAQMVYTELHGSLARVSPVALAPVGLLQANQADKAAYLPDVYYIILDGYARQDALQQDFGYDNRPFLDQLDQIGFTVPACAQSNYGYTVLSLSSSLHMNYLETFTTLPESGDKERNMIVFKDLIAHNPVRQNFERLGYRTVAFETGYWWADVTDADLYLVAAGRPVERARGILELNGFEDMLLRTSAARALIDSGHFGSSSPGLPVFPDQDQQHYDMVRYSLDELEQVAKLKGPKFVYAHIIAPHSPFVFRPDGSYFYTPEVPFSPGYRDEVEYLNQRVIALIEDILRSSRISPVIVIQADHGWEMRNRMKILNAYYLPGDGVSPIYDTITPVNTFRVIFDRYFGGSYGLVPDRSFFSLPGDIYNFDPVPITCVGKK